MNSEKDREQRALRDGYRALLATAIETLLYIRDECNSRDEMHTAASEGLAQLGEGDDES